MTSGILTGGCLCGAVRYEIGGAMFEETNCHCSICRKSSGAPYLAWLTLATADFRFVAGTPAIYRSSAAGSRQFCSNCGTQLTFRGDSTSGEVDVTIASLDDPEAVPPRANSFSLDRLSWVPLDRSLPLLDGEVPRTEAAAKAP